MRKITAEEIEAAKSEKGGWTKKILEKWDVPWPPPMGWKESLINGTPLNEQNFKSEALRSRYKGDDAGKLLHKVVMAVIETGNSGILAEIEGLNEYFGHKMPTVEEIIGERPEYAKLEGGIEFDDKVYRFSCVRKARTV